MPAGYKDLPIVSVSLAIINTIVFIVCIFTGELLYDMGGLSAQEVLGQQEYGRLLWSMFLHSDTEHLFSNMIWLVFMGAMLEKETGHLCITIVYFLSGLGGNVLSLVNKVITWDPVMSVGASGAIFGLDGLLLAMALFSREYRNTVLPVRLIAIIALSIYNGFMAGNIDNAAHIGGLTVGFVVGSIYTLARNMRQRKYKREVQI
ncbi:MAG: rhomboid family intramembrane serine protease [Butyrivibrio sp.]|nr:rhomboid family intramembrane serine protease [Muribaculum sp.]MCM1552452.1 rhomboid family intramembrane serine protease [Butyrivibrio sp.]